MLCSAPSSEHQAAKGCAVMGRSAAVACELQSSSRHNRKEIEAGHSMPSRKATPNGGGEPLAPPRTRSRNARVLVCGYFDGVERCRRRTLGFIAASRNGRIKSCRYASIQQDHLGPKRLWQPPVASSDCAHLRQHQQLSLASNTSPCLAHPCPWAARARGTSASATPGTRGPSAS